MWIYKFVINVDVNSIHNVLRNINKYAKALIFKIKQVLAGVPLRKINKNKSNNQNPKKFQANLMI